MLLQTSKQYFARRAKTEIGEYLQKKLQEVQKDTAGALGMRSEELNAYRHYYGKDYGAGTTTNAQRFGKAGELVSLRINKARTYLKALHALITAPKLTWRPMARNSDSGAVKATNIAANLLEDQWKNRGLGGVTDLWTEQALAMAQAFVFPEWDLLRGKTLAHLPPSKVNPLGRCVKEGELTYHNILPMDRYKDERRRSPGNLDWEFIRLQKNRWDLAAVWTTLIDGSSSFEAIMGAKDPLQEGDAHDDDTAVVYYFFHRPSPSLPKGREVVFLDAKCVLVDRPLPQEKALYRLAADEMFDSPNAWSQFWDALGVQEIRDGVESAVATNYSTLGTQIVAVEKGSAITTDMLHGMKKIEVPKGGMTPQGVNLVKQAEGVNDYLARIDGEEQQMFALNDVAMGQPQSAQMNAQAFAVLASMASQNAAPFQTKRLQAIAELGRGVLETLQRNVDTPRVIEVVGRTNKTLFTEQKYTGKDLAPVRQVTIDIGNALEQTPAGRQIILRDYIEMGAITTPDDYQQVAETGRLDTGAMRAKRDEKLLVTAEYEALSMGENPPVHTFQDHLLHARENTAVLLNPENLKNVAVVEAVQAHFDAHYRELWGIPDVDETTGEPVDIRAADPLYLDRIRIMLGQQAPASLMMQFAPPPVPAPGAAPGAEAPPDAVEALTPPGGPTTDGVEMPTMPANPLTGGEFNPTDGNVLAPAA